jgi:ADP-heptose:LPS heptosyltransferase
MAEPQRILVIKHSALGDFVLATAAFRAIRRHHPAAHITLLTTKPYRAIAEASGLFDAIWIDSRPPPTRPVAWWRLARRLRGGGFRRVYDLQRSSRTGWYLRLFGRRKPEWVGRAPGASHRYDGAGDRRHIAEREAEQLALAGITDIGLPDLSFLTADIARFELPPRFALLVPGGAPHRPAKRWPAANFAALGLHLAGEGIAPVLLGTASEASEIAEIRQTCPAARDLHGQTDFADLAELARRAELAVGNDTGPMHLIAAAGCPSVVLFSAESDPVKVAPRGPWVRTLQRDALTGLPVEDVVARLPEVARG